MTKTEAQKQAAALVADLGDDWTADVFNNIDWHVHANSTCGRYTVFKASSGGYCCLLGDDGAGMGAFKPGTGMTARESVKNAWDNACEYLLSMQKYITDPPMVVVDAIQPTPE